MSFSSDSKTLITADERGQVVFWNLEEDQLLKKFQVTKDRSIGFSPSGNFGLEIGFTIDKLKLWDFRGEGTLRLLELDSDLRAWTFDEKEELLATGTQEGSIYLWDLKTGQERFLFDPQVSDSDAMSYDIYNEATGNTITYTLPCGSPIPGNATCVCNCVAGNLYPEYAGEILTPKLMNKREKKLAKLRIQQQKQSAKRSKSRSRSRSRTICTC